MKTRTIILSISIVLLVSSKAMFATENIITSTQSNSTGSYISAEQKGLAVKSTINLVQEGADANADINVVQDGTNNSSVDVKQYYSSGVANKVDIDVQQEGVITSQIKILQNENGSNSQLASGNTIKASQSDTKNGYQVNTKDMIINIELTGSDNSIDASQIKSTRSHMTIDVSGNNNDAKLLQDSYSNSSTMTLEQIGNGNEAIMEQRNFSNKINLSQDGNYNYAEMTQYGYRNSATLEQTGYNLYASIEQNSQNNFITLVQVGNSGSLELHQD